MKMTFDSITKIRSERYKELFGDKAVEYFDQALCDFIERARTKGTSEADAAIKAQKTANALVERFFPKGDNSSGKA